MIYKYFIKLTKAGISALIFFLPLKMEYLNNTIIISTQLKDPITKEIRELVKSGFVFGLEYYGVVIINDKKSYNNTEIKKLSYENEWYCNDKMISEKEIQDEMGKVILKFPEIVLQEGDKVLIYIKSTILPDKDFKKSVGIPTKILWNYYIPSIKNTYIYKNGNLIKE
ncbi:MAG: hypothetical protein ACFFDN_41875 [Candidatus Hodarchaeota archaeon]